jgi:hypothetical protein
MDVIELKALKELQNANLMARSCNLCNDLTLLTIKRAIQSAPY